MVSAALGMGCFVLSPMLTDGRRGVHRPFVLVSPRFRRNVRKDSGRATILHGIGTIVPIFQRGFTLKRWLFMMVVLAIFFSLLGGPNVSFYDVTSGGPPLAGGYAPTSASIAAAADDGASGGPSMTAPVAPPLADGGSGGPSHP